MTEQPRTMGYGPGERPPFRKGDRVRLIRPILRADMNGGFDETIVIPVGMQATVDYCGEIMVRVTFDGWATSQTHHNFRFELIEPN